MLHLKKKKKQNPREVDNYINEFEQLVSKAGWGCNAYSTIEAFQKEVVIELLQACCQRCPPPATLQG
jgi:hypothetical protein